jgi:hypothetical protein
VDGCEYNGITGKVGIASITRSNLGMNEKPLKHHAIYFYSVMLDPCLNLYDWYVNSDDTKGYLIGFSELWFCA